MSADVPAYRSWCGGEGGRPMDAERAARAIAAARERGLTVRETTGRRGTTYTWWDADLRFRLEPTRNN